MALSYGVVLLNATFERILKLQKRALRLIYSAHHLSHAIPYFHQANILPINLLYFKSVSLLM